MSIAPRRLHAWLTRFESVLAALAYTIVALLLISDVLGREAFGHSVYGAHKMAVFAAVVAGFLGFSLATGAARHLRPGFLDGVFPQRLNTLVWRIADGLSAVIYIFFAIVAIEFIITSMQAGDKAAVLYWVLWPFQIVIPYAFFSSGLQHMLFAIWPELKPQSDGIAVH